MRFALPVASHAAIDVRRHLVRAGRELPRRCAVVQPQAALDQLGLDSLALMEFVFAVEDRFDVRIPEERLDPRQAGVTLEQLAILLDEAVAAKARRAMSSAASRAAAPPVVVSGSGVVSPIGVGLGAFDEALFAGRSALRAHAIDLPGLDVPAVPLAAADFDAAAVVAPSRLPLDRATAMALAAAEEAARAAGLADASVDGERLGIFWGSGMAGASTFETTCRTVYAERRRMRPTSVVTTMPNAPTAELALRFGARGAALAYACACASSAVAIGEAMRAIRAGWIDIAIAGGSESLLTPGVVASWQAMRVLAPLPAGGPADAAERACRPFAADRAGFGLGEAAAAFVLESGENARARGAAPAWQLAGYATNCDGVHITNPDAAGQARAMHAALVDAGLSAAAIGHLNAHGTATLAGDAAEAESIAARVRPACRAGDARRRRSTAICSAPAGRSSCSRRRARSLPGGCRRPRTRCRRSRLRARSGHRRGATGARAAPRDVELVRVRRDERGADRVAHRLGASHRMSMQRPARAAGRVAASRWLHTAART